MSDPNSNPDSAAPQGAFGEQPQPFGTVPPVDPMQSAPQQPSQPAQFDSNVQPADPYQADPNQQPMPGMYGAPVTAPAKKKMNKGLVIGLSVGIPVVVIVVIAIILVNVMSNRISPDDYADAAKQASSISTEYYNVSSAYSDLYMGIADASTSGDASDTDRLAQKLKAFDDESKKLGTMKAIADPDIKKLYDKYAKDKTAFDKYINGMVDTYPALYTFSSTCNDEPYGTGDSDAMAKILTWIDSCRAASDDLSKVSVSDIAKVGTATTAALDKMKPIIQDLQTLSSDPDLYTDSSKFQKLMDDEDSLTDVSNELTTAMSDLGDSFMDSTDAIDPSSSLEDLTQALQKKSF